MMNRQIRSNLAILGAAFCTSLWLAVEACAQTQPEAAQLQAQIGELSEALAESQARVRALERELALERASINEEINAIEARCQWALANACTAPKPSQDSHQDGRDDGSLEVLYSAMRAPHAAMIKRDLAAGQAIDEVLANPRFRIYPQALRGALRRGLCAKLPDQC